MPDPKNIRLYADDRQPEVKEIIEYLMKNDIIFSTIPTSGHVPFLNVGMARYEGFEQIKTFVEKSKRVESVERKTLFINLRSGKNKDKVVVACDGVFAEGRTTAEALGMLLLTHSTKFINFCPQHVEYDIEDRLKSEKSK